MYSKEESKQIRKQFWIFFAKRYPRKWILYNTGIKDFNFKFNFSNNGAMITIDCESNDQIDRAYYFDKLKSLKKLLLDQVSQHLIFDENYSLESGKVISRVYLKLEDVKINNKKDWPEVFDFFSKYMSKIEVFYEEFEDFIKS